MKIIVLSSEQEKINCYDKIYTIIIMKFHLLLKHI